MQPNAQIRLKSGEVFYGRAAATIELPTYGEVVFNTGMVGYVEALTDPSYAGQILVFTYPLIGNYGVSAKDSWESKKIHAKGVIVSELSPFYEHYDADQSFASWLNEQHIPCLMEVDTRALTKCLRTKGVIPGALTSIHHQQSITFEDFDHIHWVKKVSINKPEYYGDAKHPLVIAVDCGMKENILRHLSRFPLYIKRVPYDYDYTDEDYAGIFISNGPGDPMQCQETIAILRKALLKQKPIFGICLGTQLMALATGATTYKLSFGHRSHNQPCLHTTTNKSYLTSQNHGYAIDANTLSEDWYVSFRNLNDESVAGIAHRTLPFFSVQFHPEAAPGPHDTAWLFQQFYDLLINKNGCAR